jgi:hypothetical protein
MKPLVVRLWLAGSILLALVTAPFLVRGDQAVLQLKKQNAAAIANMSEAQRQRLSRNLDDYQRMDPQQRTAVETLHGAIERDRSQGTGELAVVMSKYDAWLKTIEPYQRDQLGQAKDSAARIELIQDIVRRQREQAARRNTSSWPPGNDRPLHDWPPALDEKSLGNVMNALEQAARPRLNASQIERLQGLNGLKRSVQLLQDLHDFGTGVNPRPFLESANSVPREFTEVAQNIDQYVDDARVRQRIESNIGPWSAGQRLGGVLLQSLMTELYKQRRLLERQPDPKKLEEFLASLPAEEQNELLTREASDFQIDLRERYMDAAGMDDLPSARHLRELFLGRRPGPGGDDRREGGNDERTRGPAESPRNPASFFGSRDGRNFRDLPDRSVPRAERRAPGSAMPPSESPENRDSRKPADRPSVPGEPNGGSRKESP